MTAQQVAAILLDETTFHDRPPARFQASADDDEERETASRTAFTAFDHAQTVDRRYHPRTWKAVRGSPYEREYRRQFKVPEQNQV